MPLLLILIPVVCVVLALCIWGIVALHRFDRPDPYLAEDLRLIELSRPQNW